MIARRLKVGRDAVIITNRRLSALYGAQLQRSLNKAGLSARFIFVPDSEKAKSIKTATQVLSRISSFDKNKRVFIIALGGGVVGDLAGFVASVYKRGIPFIQVPTSLLAQVDSAIGGKVAVDMPVAKNLVGAFYQPRAVISDISVIGSLPKRQISSALSEIIKYGIIKDPALFSYIEKNIKRLKYGDKKALEHVVGRSAAIKAALVSADELDNKGLRVILNYGHTIGHAIEAAGGYRGRYNHGEAIAVGMVAAARLSERLGLADRKTVERIISIIAKAGLPVAVKGVKASKVYESLLHDKKFVRGKNRFVLPQAIGMVRIVENIPEALVRQVIEERIKG